MSEGERERSGTQLASRHQLVLALLSDAGQPLHVTELAERLVKQDGTVMSDDEFANRFERKQLSLHHNVLPRLSDSGVINYDQETNTVSSPDAGRTDIDWFDGDSIAQVLSTLQGEPPTEGDSIGLIQGRQTVIDCGRALADEATAELFCMYVSTDLLEDECLSRAEAAVDRGVEMYVGSRDADVRELTRRHLPAATIWEPRRGWVNSPPGYPKVGRLVLVDRRKIMLALLDEPGPDGAYPEESALVAEGEENPLIVLVRELLGPRLDHLDLQSSDFRSGLHT